MDHANDQSTDNERLQGDVGCSAALHTQMTNSAPTSRVHQHQPLYQSHAVTHIQPTHQAHPQTGQNNMQLQSNSSHNRSHSIDSNGGGATIIKSPAKTKPRNLDPTGMFRNRGRRVITASQSPNKKNYQRHTTQMNYDDSMPTSTSNNNLAMAMAQQQIQGTRYDNVISSNANSQPLNMSDNLSTMQSTQQSQQPQLPHTNNLMENQSLEQTMKQEEPEKDHPPQSPLLDPNSIGATSDHSLTAQRMQNHDARQSNIQNEILFGSNSNLISDGEKSHSTVGSTVSIMGSLAGDGDYSSDKFDENKVRAVRQRMMQDVAEVLEEDEHEEEGGEEEYSERNSQADDKGDVTKVDLNITNTTLDISVDDNNNASEKEEDALNVSLEVNTDNDTSMLEENHCPVNEAIISPSLEDNLVIGQENGHHVVKVADFFNAKNHHTDNESKGVINNVVNAGTNNQYAPTKNNGQGESPFRAAFRRSAQGMSNHLPPLSSHKMLAGGGHTAESLKRLASPDRLDAASSAIDKAATTARMLPQVARQCFSFEDTTVDDDNFLARSDLLQDIIRSECDDNEGGGQPQSSQSANYYGLSAIASFGDDDGHSGENSSSAVKQNYHATKGLHLPDIENNSISQDAIPLRRTTPQWHPPNRTRLSHSESIIRHSQTWDNHNTSNHQAPSSYSNTKHNPRRLDYGAREHARIPNGGIRQTSSFDPWSPPSVGRGSSWGSWKEQTQHLDSNDRQFQLDVTNGERQPGYEREQKDWKEIETERDSAMQFLTCIVDETLKFDHSDWSPELLCNKCREKHSTESNPQSKSIEAIHCDDCIETMKLIANSLKETDNVEHSSVFNHDVQSSAIDVLLTSYELATKTKESSLSARKWLESIGSAKCNTPIHDIGIVEPKQPLDSAALRARLHSAESTILDKRGEISRLEGELSNCRAELRLKSSPRTHQQQHHLLPISANQSILSDSSDDDESLANSRKTNGSLVLLSPHQAIELSESQDESFAKWEKNIEMQMNLESRKEILLLKAQLLQANKKIAALENNQEIQEEEPFPSNIEPILLASSENGEPGNELFMKIAADIENEAALDTEEGDGNVHVSESQDDVCLSDPSLEKELEEYRTALITSIRAEEVGRSVRAESITSSEGGHLAQDLSKSNSSDAASDRKMINVRMIDGSAENFVTEWGDCGVALPPPPDHDLHSPIVDTILSKWSDDADTRSALIGWIESILNESNTESTPSLKLSGLDHITRDGFVMHVLPLLLRRRDIHVHLTSRAHRQTSYDIAVSVRQAVSSFADNGSEDLQMHRHPMPQENKHHLIAFQATRSGASIKEQLDDSNNVSPKKQSRLPSRRILGRSVIPELVRTSSNTESISTAVTSPISNRTPSRLPQSNRIGSDYTSLASINKEDGDNAVPNYASPSLGDDLSVASSADDDGDDDNSKHSQRQSSLMGSISGAFGLLSRKSPVERGAPNPPTNEEHSQHQRVITAPPGKIGITFVDYRGHAMVSNVSEKSPLAGWVFTSDVLVAIDDIPVSGLRTRDIVKLLTDKADRQRNLRMCSGHE